MKQYALLAAGLILACGLARLGKPAQVEARPFRGDQVASERPAVLTGAVQYLKPGSGGGLVVDFRADDESTLKVWVGPDCENQSAVRLRARLRLTGRASGGLFVAQAVEEDARLSEGQVYRVYRRGDRAYLQRGGRTLSERADQLPASAFETGVVRVSRYGNRVAYE